MNRYTEQFKKEVLEFCETHLIRDAVLKYGVSKYSINKWKGWKRDPVKQKLGHENWKASEAGKAYFANPSFKTYHAEAKRKWRKNNLEKSLVKEREYKRKRVFKLLCDYSNRHFREDERKPFERISYDKLLPFDLWKLAKKQKLICPISGLKLTRRTVSVDHIIPKSKGGRNTLDNIRLTHVWANRMRLTATDEELFKMCKTILDYQKSISVSGTQH
jgi:5-methylcytosine-specific restriction endonuclease McrA